METRKKLAEAKYFLDFLPKHQQEEKTFVYNLDAFLGAWRSVLDIMLYDFAEHYCLGFTREADMNDREFYAVAEVLKRADAKEFIKWWRKKQEKLSNELLWGKRNVSFHRGSVGIEYNYFGYGTGSASGTITFVTAISNYVPSKIGGAVSPHTLSTFIGPQFWSFSDFPNENLVDKCKEGYAKLEEIVKEAETTFNVLL